MKYAIVIPVKDEEDFIEHVLGSICQQTKLPEACLVVDDNSTDKTASIVKAYTEKYSFLRYCRYYKSGEYELGGRVVEIFEYGKQVLDKLHVEYDYIVKLDADISFKADYFRIVELRVQSKRYGILSGTPYYIKNGRKIIDSNPTWHSRGQFKIYDAKCLAEIDKIPRSLGWDCADNIIAMEAGWTTYAFRDLHYRMHRRVGNKYSFKKGRQRHGMGAYYLGYNFIYFILRCIVYLFKDPYISGSFYMLSGFMQGVFSKNERILNSSQVRLLRKLHWKYLLQNFAIKPQFSLGSGKESRVQEVVHNN